jgi:sialate O-acetylesterase
MNTYKPILSLSILLFLSILTKANVSLPAIYGDHMVLQQNTTVNLWGWGHPTEEIEVTTSWSEDTLKTVVDPNANWSVKLKTPKAGGPHQIYIQGYNKVSVEDILIGEVWLLSGQSNMEWTTSSGVLNSEEEVKQATNDQIRFFKVANRTSKCISYDVEGQWVVCSPETMPHFSAVGYFFGKKVQENLKVPIGLISSNWGGTPIETWIPKESILSDIELEAAANKLSNVPWAPIEPGVVYNTQIYPILRFSIAGTLWYQGEANTENTDTYTKMMATMIESWRKGFGIHFPFYFAQIAPFAEYGAFSGVEIRDAQRRALSIPGTGMVVTSDIGDTSDIHPRNKIDVGYRFADLALNKTYHLKEFPVSGPLYKDFTIDKSKVIVEFDYHKGLYNTDKQLNGFELAGEDGNWHSAQAKIQDEKVVVSSAKVTNPKQVRYGWKNAATPNLFNFYDLPASCFTTEY